MKYSRQLQNKQQANSLRCFVSNFSISIPRSFLRKGTSASAQRYLLRLPDRAQHLDPLDPWAWCFWVGALIYLPWDQGYYSVYLKLPTLHPWRSPHTRLWMLVQQEYYPSDVPTQSASQPALPTWVFHFLRKSGYSTMLPLNVGG